MCIQLTGSQGDAEAGGAEPPAFGGEVVLHANVFDAMVFGDKHIPSHHHLKPQDLLVNSSVSTPQLRAWGPACDYFRMQTPGFPLWKASHLPAER